MKRKELAILLAIMTTSLSACGQTDKESDAPTGQDEAPVVTEETATPESVQESVPETKSVTVTLMAANETGAISGATVKLSGEGNEVSAETDASGKAVFSDLLDGEYTLECASDGFNNRNVTINVSGSDVSPIVPLVPEMTGDDAYILLTWNGDHDLDLCAFNTEMKEYVNIGHPIDSAGYTFLYADHGSDLPYEVIYIHDASAEIAKTFYVTDVGNARNGSTSQMEADGVTISVYNSTGLIYEETAKATEEAPLWCTCYYYAGSVYDQGDYIYDTTDEQYAWISFDEKDAYTDVASADTASETEWKQAYLDYLTHDQTYFFDDYTDIPYTYNWKDIAKDSPDSMRGAFIYIDGDAVPELLLTDGTNGLVVSYHGGKVQVFGEPEWAGSVRFSGMDTYIMKRGKFIFRGGGGGWYDELCSLSDSGFTVIHKFETIPAGEDDTIYLFDGEEWNGTEEDDPFSGDYDSSKATSQEKNMTYDEIITYLTPDTPASQPADNGSTGDWKQAYLEYINKKCTEFRWNGSFIYIDDDNIPELVLELMTDYSAGEYTVLSYHNGKIQEYTSRNPDGDFCSFSFSYIERSGLFDTVAICDPDNVADEPELYDAILKEFCEEYGSETVECMMMLSEDGFHKQTTVPDTYHSKAIDFYDTSYMWYEDLISYLK